MYKNLINITYQILGVTCDNASNNDTMIESLAEIMAHFSGEANRARCLAHIVNLVAKIILRQFDMSKKRKKKTKKTYQGKQGTPTTKWRSMKKKAKRSMRR